MNKDKKHFLESGLSFSRNNMKKIFILSLFLMLLVSACTMGGDATKTISLEEAKIKAAEFINDYLMGEGQEVSIKEAVEENGLYKIVVNMADGQEIDSYLSKDGENFFPSGMNIAEFIAEAEGGDQAASPAQAPALKLADIVKTEKPKVELFIMSHCPYGTQIEKGILPVLDILGDAIDFDLKFCDYAMHDKKELDEQLSQYCVQKNNPEKLSEYLYCFLEDETQGDACLAKIGINKSQHSTCVRSTDEEYKVTAMYEDRNTWRNGRFPVFAVDEADNKKYGITGSPGLVVNGKKIQSPRDSASLLETICAGFENQPEACQSELSSVPPAAGFGFDGAGSASAASCGS